METLPGTTGQRQLLRPGLARRRPSPWHLAPLSRRMTDAQALGAAAAAKGAAGAAVASTEEQHGQRSPRKRGRLSPCVAAGSAPEAGRRTRSGLP